MISDLATHVASRYTQNFNRRHLFDIQLQAFSLFLPLTYGRAYTMPARRFEPSQIKNKEKREEVARKQKKEKRQSKLKRRLTLAKAETDDPAAKKVCT